MTTMILLGAPGAGKGTQAARISEELGIPWISTGDIFRSNISEGTQLGKLAQEFMDRGELVPDSVTNLMVKARLAAPDTHVGFLLDGYPRNVEQAHALRDILTDKGLKLDIVLEIDVDEEQVVKRMLNRAQEQHRADDTEPVIRHRLEVYHQSTEPMATYYADQDLLEVVDGNGSVEEVFNRVMDTLNRVVPDSRQDWATAHANGEGECCGADED